MAEAARVQQIKEAELRRAFAKADTTIGESDGKPKPFEQKLVIYLDYNATTPLDLGVREAMLPFLGELWGNPSSPHQVGRKARARLDEARERLSLVLACKPSELTFTSGGTEANNLAILGAARRQRSRGRHIITTTIEHHAVLHCVDYLEKYEGFEVTRLLVSREGLVNPEDVRRSIRADTVLVSVMAANNEVGSLQATQEIGAFCTERGVWFHTDAVQWFGKLPFSGIEQFGADMVSLCSHKFHGPKGAGALYVRSPIQPHPILFGGGHENEKRAGTENMAGIIGLVTAAEKFLREPVFGPERLRTLLGRLTPLLAVPGVQRAGPAEGSLPNTFSVVVDGADSIALLANLDLEGICASSGSACSAGSLEPSHVVKALGFSDALANSLVRFSLGRETTAADVDALLAVWPEVVARARAN